MAFCLPHPPYLHKKLWPSDQPPFFSKPTPTPLTLWPVRQLFKICRALFTVCRWRDRHLCECIVNAKRLEGMNLLLTQDNKKEIITAIDPLLSDWRLHDAYRPWRSASLKNNRLLEQIYFSVNNPLSYEFYLSSGEKKAWKTQAWTTS